MTHEQKMKSSPIYKVLEEIRERRLNGYDYIDLNDLESLIKDEAPEHHELFQKENPQEPGDGESWTGGFADNH